MSKVRVVVKDSKKSISIPFKDYWDKFNYLILGAGGLLLLLGYYLMGQGTWDSTESLTLSPIILFLAYIVVIPLAILFTKKKKQ